MKTSVNPKISIIIPIYNAEKYLERCIQSIITQSYKNLEIICINDGSEDDSLNLLNKFSKIDPRIKVLSQENMGIATTRNIGLNFANGDFISFVDADDWLEQDTYSILVETINNHQDIDLISFGANVINARNANTKEFNTNKNWYNAKWSGKCKVQDINLNKLPASLWHFLFKNSIIKNNNLNFSQYKTGEDVLFLMKYLCHSRYIYFIDQNLYNYILTPNSAITKYGDNHNPEFTTNTNINILKEALEYYTDKDNFSFFQHKVFKRLWGNILGNISKIKNKNYDKLLNELDELVSILPKEYDFGKDILAIRQKEYYRIHQLDIPYKHFGKKFCNCKYYKSGKPELCFNLFGIKLHIHYKKIFSVTNEIDKKHKVFNIFGTRIKIKLNKKKHNPNNIEIIKEYISNEVITANIIQDLHQKTFPQYKNCNLGKDIVIVACGPTMKFYKPIKDAIHIGLNKAYQNNQIKLDYIFAQDYSSIKTYIDEIINYNANIFLGSFLIQNYNGYTNFIIPEKYKNIEKINYYYSNFSKNVYYPYLEYYGLMDFGSVAFPAAQFALYTQPKRIYLVGCDCSSSGYFDGSKQPYRHSLSHLIEPWKEFKKYCRIYYPEVEIISVNPVGLKGIFNEIYTDEYLEFIRNRDNKNGK